MSRVKESQIQMPPTVAAGPRRRLDPTGSLANVLGRHRFLHGPSGRESGFALRHDLRGSRQRQPEGHLPVQGPQPRHLLGKRAGARVHQEWGVRLAEPGSVVPGKDRLRGASGRPRRLPHQVTADHV